MQSVVTRNGAILEIVGIDSQDAKSDLDNWINSSMVTITSLRDPDGTYPQSKNVFMTREWWFLVDLSTMKIAAKYFGSYGGGTPSLTAMNSALDDINGRL